MARQHPRKGRQIRWIAAAQLPPAYAEHGLRPWIAAHEQAHPCCWACGAPGVHTILVESRELNPLGGNVTCYTLCQRCTDDQQVRRRVIKDLERDAAQAAQIRSN